MILTYFDRNITLATFFWFAWCLWPKSSVKCLLWMKFPITRGFSLTEVMSQATSEYGQRETPLLLTEALVYYRENIKSYFKPKKDLDISIMHVKWHYLLLHIIFDCSAWFRTNISVKAQLANNNMWRQQHPQKEAAIDCVRRLLCSHKCKVKYSG